MKTPSEGQRVGEAGAQKTRRKTLGCPHALAPAHERLVRAHRDKCTTRTVWAPLGWPAGSRREAGGRGDMAGTRDVEAEV
ncbi:hypothetical protein BV22DRAFT_1027660 [Leucogyrophana mollusca]|uniref:Uncharacterized protein n=1 Tax=Leucogyrophana mollusca TaxID=85980 RepID=A0ACB8C181_9AGAM|nr:hypothetical protein BV22DRAFT_1027660 [Leucogyrophana mollusca]